MADVVCMGELLIEFVATHDNVALTDVPEFVRGPGGAPANVAVALQKLGVDARFVGKVGDDPFGRYLRDSIGAEGVDVAHVLADPQARTTAVFVAVWDDGRKDLCFYRNPGADMHHDVSHVNAAYVRSAGVLHFGSISRIDERPRAATDRARTLAAEAGAMITYDPNWRPSLCADHDAAREVIREGFDGVHVAKLAEEEWRFITGEDDFRRGAETILARGVGLVVRSEGQKGASFATANGCGHVGAFQVDCVDPLGAGDAFMACLIVELLSHWRQGRAPSAVEAGEIERIVRRANAVGALGCTRRGAIPSLPTREEVERFLGP